MENAFNAFTNAAQPMIQALVILRMLVLAFGCPNSIVGLIEYLSLPLKTDKALVSKDVIAIEVIGKLAKLIMVFLQPRYY
jgi:hypothetical protein